MASPRFIGIRDVVNPYRGLQESVSKVGDIYRQYHKDIQEADRIRNEEDRIRNEEARQNERLAMDRDKYKQQQDKYAEEQRRNEVIRGFDPEKQIENYGIPERFIPEINKQDEQVRDYYSRAPLIAAGSGAEGTQARQQAEESLRTARTEAFDAVTAQRQGLEYLISQGVPAGDAVAIVQARTLGQSSIADKEKEIAAAAKAEDDRALELAKIQGNILGRVISANRTSATGGTTASKTANSSGIIPENFPNTEVTPAEINKAVKDLTGVIGDGALWWSGDATKAVNNVNSAVTEINKERTAHNEQVRLGNIKADLMPLVSFQEGVNWLTATAKVGGNVEFKSPGEVKTFLEDRASQRDFSDVGELARKQDGRTSVGGDVRGNVLTGADVQSIMPQRTIVPPIDDVVRSRLSASYARMFPEVFPSSTRATTPIPRPSNTTADEEVDSKTDTKSAADGKPNIIGGTLNNIQAPEQSEQSEQPISREVLLPYNTESPTSIQADINSTVTRLAEIQKVLAGPSLGWGGKKELRQEAETIRDSLKQLSDSGRIFEAIRGNAGQAKTQSAEEQAQAQKEQKRKESEEKEVKQIRERLAGNLSPTVERINKDRLQELLNGTERTVESKNTSENRLTPSNEPSTREYIQETFGPTSGPFIDNIMSLPNPPDTEVLSAPIIDDKVTLSSPVHPDIPVIRSNKALRENKTVLFGTNEGDLIKTVKGGRVRFVGPIRNRGQSIIIEHDDGTIATYSDWSEDVRVKKDERIKAGDVLMVASGVRDKTMFSVYDKNVKPEDPLEWLKKNTSNA